MSNIVTLFPSLNVADTLRRIADRIDAGDLPANKGCTLVLGMDVFYAGCVSDEVAVVSAVFDLTFAINKLMRPAVDASLGL